MSEKELRLNDLKQECINCHKCVLGNTRNNTVFSDGSCDAKIMLIGEAPGADEDATGTPFVGRAGKLLTKLMEETGLSRENDIYITNTVKCRPPENRVPSDEEKKLCENFLLKQIEIVKPKVIVLCGATSFDPGKGGCHGHPFGRSSHQGLRQGRNGDACARRRVVLRCGGRVLRHRRFVRIGQIDAD